ncbi:MAG TPA: hypothetical protein ENN22_00540 [bacterium]|nr:hypothetical protein [bacterium]HDP97659.1 hypothetical protein [bacterium]
MDSFNKIAQTSLVLCIASIWIHLALQIIKFGKEFGSHIFEWGIFTIVALCFAGISFIFWVIAIIYNIWK